jgi:transcriptional regulator with XRE-family HTH domain
LPVRRVVLIRARVEKGYRVKELASALGVSRSLLYKIEEGVRDPGFGLMGAMATKLEKTVDALFFAPDPDETSAQEASVS